MPLPSRLKTRNKVSLFFLLTTVGSSLCSADNLYFQGFEADTSGWYLQTGGDGNGSITRVPSGGGIGVPAYDGSYYALVANNTNSYSTGYGAGGYTFFGNASSIPPYPGPYTTSIAVYINTSTQAPTDPATPAFWIDGSPSSTAPQDAGNGGVGYGAEHNFRLSYTGASVTVDVDGGAPIATLTTSGWYLFQMSYSDGPTPTSLTSTTLNLLNGSGMLIGTDTALNDEDGETLESQYLAGPGYDWITVWQNGFSDNQLGIDDIRADTVNTPEPASAALLGAGALFSALLTAFRKRRAS